jgi:hypothetical protein
MKLSDFITDKNGDGDECRLAGWIVIGIAILYGVIKGLLRDPDWTGFAALTGFGVLLFGGGLLGDKVKPNAAPPAPKDTGAGIPGS